MLGRMATATPRKSVLLVEDEEDIRAAVAEILEDEGFEVVIASNGVEALDELKHMGRPTLIVLDLMMPVMNGHEFLASIRDTPKLKAVPVLVLTAVATEAPPGARDMLRKPFIVEELLEAVQRVCAPAP
ncbi:MAG TPA: response regulator transcription factor [Myxococcus sp.]|nr:response regulator transcription factor [Myxococcus sp.]